MQINITNGDLLIGDICIYRNQSLFDFLNEVKLNGYLCELHIENHPYKGYTIKRVSDGDNNFSLQIYFTSDRIDLVCVSLNTDDNSLEEFIEKSLERVKAQTLELTKAILSTEYYKAQWGSAGYSFDPRSCSVSMVIRYL